MTTLAEKVGLLRTSGLFDEAWYVARYPDVARTSLSPAEHYIRIGQLLGRKPNAGGEATAVTGFLAASRVSEVAESWLDDDLRSAIAASRLYDDAWYRANCAHDLPAAADGLADYFQRSASTPSIDPGPLFSTIGYALAHSDAATLPPLVHAAKYGLGEGRPVLDAHKVNTYLTDVRDQACVSFEQLLDRSMPVQVVVWQEGNFFFTEIAEFLAAYLRRERFDAIHATDLMSAGTTGANIVVVAPHEFCVYGPGKDWSEQQFRQAVYLNTEQWHTGWFSLAYKFMARSNKAIDMNPASAAGLQHLGIRTAFLPILPLDQTAFQVDRAPLSEGFARGRYIADLTYPEALDERPYDLLFVGASNGRREAALGTIAPVLSEYEAFVHCPRFNGPVRKGHPDMMSTSDLVQIARNAKILLNIHQGESQYFEWHRLFLFGIMEGCVVLTEPCIPNAYVQADVHYIECEIADMPARLNWLLGTGEGRAELARVRASCDRLRQGGASWMERAA